MAIAEDMGDIPPNWLVYFAVEDCDETLKKVESEGGKVAGPPTDVPEIGRLAVAQDPQGAYFAFIRLVNPL